MEIGLLQHNLPNTLDVVLPALRPPTSTPPDLAKCYYQSLHQRANNGLISDLYLSSYALFRSSSLYLHVFS
jgi:hypothetical protein